MSRLVLTRKLGQAVVIGDGDRAVTVYVARLAINRITGAGHVVLSIDAPPDVPIDRDEVRRDKEQAGLKSQI